MHDMVEEPQTKVGKTAETETKSRAQLRFIVNIKTIYILEQKTNKIEKKCHVLLPSPDLLVISTNAFVISLNIKDAKCMQFPFILICLISSINLSSLNITV